jgi:ATP phosphoribosyltransferase regulatory subunit
MTGQVGRIAVTRMGHRRRPLRLAYGGPVLKLRATQLRPEREMIQTGAELIGSDTVAAVIEILRVAIEALEVAGVKGISIDLTLPDLVETLASEALPLSPDKIGAVRDRLDAKDAGGLAALGAHEYLPLIAAAGPVDAAREKLREIGADAVASRLGAIDAINDAIGSRVALTLDPTEQHGFEYQSWIGFSFFGEGLTGEIGRGGTYAIVHPGGRDEPAVGFSVYLDPLVDAGLGVETAHRVFLPLDHDPDAAFALRRQGWMTVAALSGDDTAQTLGCTHVLDGDQVEPIPRSS